MRCESYLKLLFELVSSDTALAGKEGGTAFLLPNGDKNPDSRVCVGGELSYKTHYGLALNQ